MCQSKSHSGLSVENLKVFSAEESEYCNFIVLSLAVTISVTMQFEG